MPILDHPYARLTAQCAEHNAVLVAVSKTRSINEIMRLYHMGQRVFAENRAQELLEKVPLLPEDIQWHIIGHLQTNKVKSILPYVDCIQSLDSEKLWAKIDQEAGKIGRDKKVKCLLQIKIAKEETKYGWTFEQVKEFLQHGNHKAFENVIITGVMGMSTLTDDRELIKSEMQFLKLYFEELKADYFATQPNFQTISMGMSGDYDIALEQGSNMVRIGSLLFP